MSSHIHVWPQQKVTTCLEAVIEKSISQPLIYCVAKSSLMCTGTNITVGQRTKSRCITWPTISYRSRTKCPVENMLLLSYRRIRCFWVQARALAVIQWWKGRPRIKSPFRRSKNYSLTTIMNTRCWCCGGVTRTKTTKILWLFCDVHCPQSAKARLVNEKLFEHIGDLNRVPAIRQCSVKAR